MVRGTTTTSTSAARKGGSCINDREVIIVIKPGKEAVDVDSFMVRLQNVQPWIPIVKKIRGRSSSRWEDDGVVIEVEIQLLSAEAGAAVSSLRIDEFTHPGR